MAKPSRSGQGRNGPTLMHPLVGADLRTLLTAYRRYGPPPVRRLPHAALTVLAAVGRLPFTMLERAEVARRRRSMPPLEPPVFVVGHWRSGTTHLHNLLGRSHEFALISPLASGMPWELLTLATWLRPLLERALPEDRGVDRVAVTPDSPQEDEIPVANMQPLSVFHAVYFPRRFLQNYAQGVFFDGVSDRDVARWKRQVEYFHTKVALHQGRNRLLVKNPAYTARIARLREIWPRAKFIHIYRNPYVVYASTVHYYRKLLPELALQRFDHVDVEAFVLETFPRLMDRLYAESAELPAEQFAEVRYEELERDPMAVLEALHLRLELPGWDRARPAIESYLETIEDYRKNRFAYPRAMIDRVGEAWRPYVERWGYDPPADPAGVAVEADHAGA